MRRLYGNSRKKRWFAAAAASLICLLALIPDFASLAAKTGTVRINDVNVRSEANTESNRVCKLPINTNVDIAEEKNGEDGKLWYSVSFTYEGEQKTGWIRSDMLTVSESEEEPQEETPGNNPAAGSYTIAEPEGDPGVGESMTQTAVQVGDASYTAWAVNSELTGGAELYLVYAAKADGSMGWYFYDPQEGTFQRNLGQFAGSGAGESQGLVESLTAEVNELKETSEKQLSQRMYIIAGLGIVCLILVVTVILFAVKSRNAVYEYEEDEDDGEDQDDEEAMEARRPRWFRRKSADEEDEDDGFSDFVNAVKKKKAEASRTYEEEEPEDEDGSEEDTGELPRIDLTAVLEAAQESAERAYQTENEKKQVSEPEEEKQQTDDDDEDFEIEILDLEDLDL